MLIIIQMSKEDKIFIRHLILIIKMLQDESLQMEILVDDLSSLLIELEMETSSIPLEADFKMEHPPLVCTTPLKT